MNEEVILKKVMKAEKRIAFVRRCLAVRICPDCGSKVVMSVDTDLNTSYSCTSCSFCR